MQTTKARNALNNPTLGAASHSDIQTLNSRINDLEAKIINALPPSQPLRPLQPPGQDPGQAPGQLPPPPDSDLHGLNLRVYYLEGRITDLEDRVNGIFSSLSQAINSLSRRAIQIDASGNCAIPGDVSVGGHANVALDINVAGDVKLLS
jgi:hypothetical protein